MKKIRVTLGGCGIAYTDAHGKKRHTLKTPKDRPFECDDAQADRLVSLGVAVYVTEQQAATEPPKDPAAGSKEPDQTSGIEHEENTGHLDREHLESMDYNELKKLAAEMGAEPTGKKKADLIDAIVAVDVELGDEDDTLPELDAADPE